MEQQETFAIVTGASGGIGSEICKRLVERRIRLIALDRKTPATSPQGVVAAFTVDLSDRESIAGVCAQIRRQFPRVQYLFNNAGVLPERLVFSKYGTELDFEVNALAPLQLIDGLRASLAASAPSTIVNTTAGLANNVKRLDIDELIRPAGFSKLFGPYVQSKQALNVLTAALARELAAERIAVRAADPGPTRTRLTKGAGTPLWMRIFSGMLPGPDAGARKITDAALLPQFAGAQGAFITGGRVKPLPEALADPAFQDRFLDACRRLVAQR